MNPTDLENGLTVERLRRILHFNPTTGEWTWLVTISNKIQAGSAAGTVTDRGYRRIRFSGMAFYSARLAWFYMIGEWPKEQIDHANRDRLDDRWENLREASFSQNMANRGIPSHNTSGYIGVSWDRPSGKWDARVNKIRIGLFDSLEEAVVARDAAAIDMQGNFANPNIQEK